MGLRVPESPMDIPEGRGFKLEYYEALAHALSSPHARLQQQIDLLEYRIIGLELRDYSLMRRLRWLLTGK